MIHEFKGEYKWLSNFEPVKITIDGVDFPSVEHAYMSFKSNDPEWKKFCSSESNSAGMVKKKSREIKLVDNWDSLKFSVMQMCLEKKFEQEPFKSKLIATGNQNLVEGNWHGDKIWGVDLKSNPNIGENHLGRMIMSIRYILIKEYNGGFLPDYGGDKLHNTEHDKERNILEETEYLIQSINYTTKGIREGQNDLFNHLYFDKERLSRIFNIHEEDENGQTLSNFIDEQHKYYDTVKKDLFVTKEELDEFEKIGLSLTKEDVLTEPVKKLIISTNFLTSKFMSVFGYSYQISRMKEEMYLKLSEDKLL